RSRSVSAPSAVTKTSPCWNGLMVPGSTLMYGSSFWMATERPRLLSNRPSEAAVIPLPRLDTTPPVMKMYLVDIGALLPRLRGAPAGGIQPPQRVPSAYYSRASRPAKPELSPTASPARGHHHQRSHHPSGRAVKGRQADRPGQPQHETRRRPPPPAEGASTPDLAVTSVPGR